MKELAVAVRHIASGATHIQRKHIPDDAPAGAETVETARRVIANHSQGAEFMALICIPGGK